MTTTVVTPASGKWSRTSNRAAFESTVKTPSTFFAMSWVSRCTSMAVPPKMANHTSETSDGTRRTPVMNWRIVRPREMRAMNMPTNGVQLIHQAQ